MRWSRRTFWLIPVPWFMRRSMQIGWMELRVRLRRLDMRLIIPLRLGWCFIWPDNIIRLWTISRILLQQRVYTHQFFRKFSSKWQLKSHKMSQQYLISSFSRLRSGVPYSLLLIYFISFSQYASQSTSRKKAIRLKNLLSFSI